MICWRVTIAENRQDKDIRGRGVNGRNGEGAGWGSGWSGLGFTWVEFVQFGKVGIGRLFLLT